MGVTIMSKTAVSVTEMARLVGLSRARFYQLVKDGVFPHPLYSIHTRRPYFSEEMQQVCLEVRKRNCGINGKPILFYSPRHPLGSQPKPGDHELDINRPRRVAVAGEDVINRRQWNPSDSSANVLSGPQCHISPL